MKQNQPTVPKSFPISLEAALRHILPGVKHCDRWHDYRHFVEHQMQWERQWSDYHGHPAPEPHSMERDKATRPGAPDGPDERVRTVQPGQHVTIFEFHLTHHQHHNRMAGNTYSSDLITQHLEQSATTILTSTLSPLAAFSRQFSPDEFKPRATVQCKFVTTGATTQKNSSNFESGDSIVTNVQIPVDQYTTAFHVTNDELNSGLRLEDLTLRNARSFAESVLDAVMAPISSENLATIVTRSSTAFSLSDLATAWGGLKKSSIKFAVLDGEYMARIVNSPVFYQETGVESGGGWKLMGWDGVFLNSRWSGTHAGAGDENIRGIFANPQVLGVVAGVPMRVPNPTLVTKTVTIPGLDLSVSLNVWYSLASRTIWASYDAMIGCALLDASAGFLLKSA